MQHARPASRLALLALPILALGAIVAEAAPARAQEPVESGAIVHKGGYIAFGFGYAAASGDRGVPLKTKAGVTLSIPSNLYDETVRTDFGSGMSFELRFGWLIGPIAPEIAIFGHGGFDFENGAGYPVFQLRFHPLLLVDSLAGSAFDANVYAGVGYAIGGYHHEGDDDGKGWDGLAITFGFGGSYALSSRVHLALDVKFAMPQYSKWIYDYDDDIEFEPASTPSTLIVAPSLQLQCFF
ncbi:MAG: hypothetical protein JNJ59_03995 [Deltaproteobacteria bacterium]|jgi:hypothetical protein|nr:hypothetical protein [Deltaproteobacteria bacterium]